jgi:CDP-glucose 4,6-dehydratase
VGFGHGALGHVAVTDGFWHGRTVLVTGAAGLLGGWLSRHVLASGARVIGLDIDWPGGAILAPDEPVVRLDADVRSRDDVDRALGLHRPELVLHLAAQTQVGVANDDPVGTFEHNVLGTWTVLEACRQASFVGGVVVASSDKAYGDRNGAAYVETDPLEARHPYAASKACADVLAQAYSESYGLPVAITRCGNMYGGGDLEWERIVPGTVRSLLRSERPIIRSDGRYIRDYLYVEDAAEGVARLAQAVAERPNLRGEAFNFASATRLSVLELVERIQMLMANDLEPEILDEAVNEIRDQRVDAGKARSELGWEPRHTLDDGLRSSIDWYRAYLSA